MRVRIPLPRLLATLGMLSACLGASSTSCLFGDSDASNFGPTFVTDLTLRNAGGQATTSFALGEPIDMELTVRNRLGTPATIRFPSARTSDFLVVRATSTDIVWLWSADRVFAQTLTELEFAAGETKAFAVTWDQLDDDALQVPAGTYEARGVLVYEGFDANPLRRDQLGSNLVQLTIR